MLPKSKVFCQMKRPFDSPQEEQAGSIGTILLLFGSGLPTTFKVTTGDS